MANVESFNSLGGFSVGIPPELVIDQTGNLVNNVNAPDSNVTANRVFSNAYFWSNGAPFVPNATAAGTNTQVQFNNNGNFGASAGFTFNSATNLLSVTNLKTTTANLGNVANITILGGDNGYFLQTDGAGNLTWAHVSNGGNGGNASPAGANTQVQFNDAGDFGGDAGFTYDKVANILYVNEIVTGNITANYIDTNWDVTANVVYANYLYGDGSNISNVNAATAAIAYSVDGANVVGEVNFAAVANSVAGANVSGEVAYANIANNVAGANVSGQVANALVAGTVYTAAQPNITSVGNLANLTVIGNTTLGNQVIANYFIGNLFGLANLARTVTYAAQPNITSVGVLTSLTVSGNTTLGNSVTGNYFVGNLYGRANTATLANLANAANYANFANIANLSNLSFLAGQVSDNSQPNITSVGTLTSLNVDGLANLGNISNVKIAGGSANYVITTDGTGNLSWKAQSGGNAAAGGSNTQVQFNDAGALGGVGAFVWNKSTNNLTVGGNIIATTSITTPVFVSNVATGTAPFTVNSTTPVANLGAATAGTVRTAAQPNITSVGTLTGLTVSANASITNTLSVGNITTTGTIGTSNLNVTGTANFTNTANISGSGTLNVNGKLNTASASNVNLGNVANIHIAGGLNGYVLTTDGAGTLSWSAGGGGGNGSPGGANTQLQYNNNGVFAGSPYLTYDDPTQTLQIGGNLVANTLTIGSGAYKYSTTLTYSATTSSTIPNQVIYSIPIVNLAGADYVIISTDNIGNIRNYVKISAVIYGSTVNYTETFTLAVGGYIGDFEVVYNAGNIISDPSMDLICTPQSANLMTHKMTIMKYSD